MVFGNEVMHLWRDETKTNVINRQMVLKRIDDLISQDESFEFEYKQPSLVMSNEEFLEILKLNSIDSSIYNLNFPNIVLSSKNQDDCESQRKIETNEKSRHKLVLKKNI